MRAAKLGVEDALTYIKPLDIVLERAGPFSVGNSFPGVKDLCVLGLPGLEKEKTYAFAKASPRQWKMATSLPL